MKIRKIVFLLVSVAFIGAIFGFYPDNLYAGNPDPLQGASFPGGTQQFQPGEALIISLYPDTTHFLNQSFLIDQDGYADLPIIGRLNVLDYTPQTILAVLQKKYRNYDLPNIQVRRGIRLALLGGFINPGLYFVPENSTLWQAIQLAGGTQEDDGIKKLKVLRGSQIFKSDLSSDFSSPRSLASIGIRSGDQIVVPVPGKLSGFRVFMQTIMPIVGLTTGVILAVYIRRRR